MKIDYSKLNKKEVIELLKNQIEQNDALRDAKKTQEYAIEGLENRIEVIRELAAEKQTIANALEARLSDEIEMHAQANEEIERLNELRATVDGKTSELIAKTRTQKAQIADYERQIKNGDLVRLNGGRISGGDSIETGLYILNGKLKEEVDEKAAIIERRDARIQDLKQENATLDEQNENLNGSIDIMSAQFSDAQRKIVAANQTIIKLKNDVANLSRQIK